MSCCIEVIGNKQNTKLIFPARFWGATVDTLPEVGVEARLETPKAETGLSKSFLGLETDPSG